MSLEFIKPQLATSVDQPPPRAGWIHEVKHDGYRTILIIERHKVRAYTRNRLFMKLPEEELEALRELVTNGRQARAVRR